MLVQQPDKQIYFPPETWRQILDYMDPYDITFIYLALTYGINSEKLKLVEKKIFDTPYDLNKFFSLENKIANINFLKKQKKNDNYFMILFKRFLSRVDEINLEINKFEDKISTDNLSNFIGFSISRGNQILNDILGIKLKRDFFSYDFESLIVFANDGIERYFSELIKLKSMEELDYIKNKINNFYVRLEYYKNITKELYKLQSNGFRDLNYLQKNALSKYVFIVILTFLIYKLDYIDSKQIIFINIFLIPMALIYFSYLYETETTAKRLITAKYSGLTYFVESYRKKIKLLLSILDQQIKNN